MTEIHQTLLGRPPSPEEARLLEDQSRRLAEGVMTHPLIPARGSEGDGVDIARNWLEGRW